MVWFIKVVSALLDPYKYEYCLVYIKQSDKLHEKNLAFSTFLEKYNDSQLRLFSSGT